MVVRGQQRLSYDAENHLAYVVTANSYATFGYDAQGARLWKQSSATNALQVWIGDNYEEKNGQILFHVSANGRLICTFDKTATNVFVFYQSDPLRSTAMETDSNGVPCQHYEYSSFGQDRFTASTSVFPISRRFTGQVKDEETGLYYYGARYYDPLLGRFIQPDDEIPNLFNPQSLNRYSYVLNNPLRYTDPTGHAEAESLWWSLSLGRAYVGSDANMPFSGTGAPTQKTLTAAAAKGAASLKNDKATFETAGLILLGEAGSSSGVLDNANYAQKGFSETFSSGGTFSGRTVTEVAADLRAGTIKAADVPIQYIVKDGKPLILNTRSAQALEQAGIPRNAWNTVNKTRDAAAQARLTAQLKRSKLPKGGTKTVKPIKKPAAAPAPAPAPKPVTPPQPATPAPQPTQAP